MKKIIGITIKLNKKAEERLNNFWSETNPHFYGLPTKEEAEEFNKALNMALDKKYKFITKI